MEGSTKGKVGVVKAEEQSWPEKPFSLLATPHDNGISSAVSGAVFDDPTIKADQADLDTNMDPKKLKRIMSNRLSARRSRMRKMHYVADLERQAKTLEVQVAALHPQIESYKNHKRLLILEQKMLDQQVASLERKKLLREAEIEKNKVEMNMLRELHMLQEEQIFQAQMFNWDIVLPLMSIDPISNHYTNTDQVAPSGEEINIIHEGGRTKKERQSPQLHGMEKMLSKN